MVSRALVRIDIWLWADLPSAKRTESERLSTDGNSGVAVMVGVVCPEALLHLNFQNSGHTCLRFAMVCCLQVFTMARQWLSRSSCLALAQMAQPLKRSPSPAATATTT